MLSKENTILKGRILPALIRFTLPLMLAVLIQGLYGAVDLIIVGRFGSTASVSSVANGSQIMHMLASVIHGLATGVTVFVGNRIGAGDKKGAADAVGAIVKLFSALTVLLMAVMLIFANDVAHLMQVPQEAVAGTVTYLRVCSSGLIFIVGFNVISAIFRGVGNSKSPLLFIAIACVVNIVLDLLFCGVFGWDVFGAALATVIAQGASVVFSVVKIKNGGLPFRVTKKNFKRNSEQIKRIAAIGSPVALQELLVSISFLMIVALINDISLVASAAIGIAEKMFLFLAIIPMSFMSSLSAFVAQNIGAHQEDRAFATVRIAAVISFVFGICITALTFFAGDKLALVFEDDPAVIASVAEYLRGACFEYLMLPITFCLLGYFNGTGKTTFMMLEGIISAFLVRVPMSYYLSRLPDTNLFTIALAVPIASLVSMTACIVFFIILRKKRLRLT